MIKYINPILSNYAVLSIAVLLTISFIFQLYFYLRYYTAVGRHLRLSKKGKIPYRTDAPPVSIIICAKNEQENLKNFLPHVLEQDYPNFEVIVVNDGSYDNSEDILCNMRNKYSHLYFTSMPKDSRIISRKKLAITVGIKAAKNDILLFTDADCMPVSNQWIKLMVRNFTPGVEFVIGYGGYFNKPKFINCLINYDTLFIGNQFLSFAKCNKPYMGVGRNMAYLKETFYNRKGFAGLLHIPSGDDDLLINTTATKKNTRIEVDPMSITLSEPKSKWIEWWRQKRRHLTTVPLYSEKSKFLLGLEPFTRGLFYLSILLGIILFPHNNSLLLYSLLLVLLRYCIQLVILNKRAQKWKSRPLILMPIIGDIFLPITTFILLVSSKLTRKKRRYSW